VWEADVHGHAKVKDTVEKLHSVSFVTAIEYPGTGSGWPRGGTSGAGKTTLARRIADRLLLPHIELDAVNWQSEWRDLTRYDPEEFARRVTEAIQAEAWVVDGNYSPVWRRATHLLWLDYDRAVIMGRVISRSFLRALLRTVRKYLFDSDS